MIPSLEQIVNEVDPNNAPYIIGRQEIKTSYKTLQSYAEENNEKMYGFCLKELKEKIGDFKNKFLTPLNINIGDGVTIHLWSDAHAATVIKVTKATVTVQQDKAIRDPNFKPEFIIGGFAGHCTNQDKQTYTYELDPDGRIYTFRWSNKYCRYGQPGDLTLSKGRHEFYDYNY